MYLLIVPIVNNLQANSLNLNVYNGFEKKQWLLALNDLVEYPFAVTDPRGIHNEFKRRGEKFAPLALMIICHYKVEWGLRY